MPNLLTIAAIYENFGQLSRWNRLTSGGFRSPLVATLARRRPDIRHAEAQLHAATANVGLTTASFYPDDSLSGDFGLRAIDASFLTNWASAFYSFGPERFGARLSARSVDCEFALGAGTDGRRSAELSRHRA